MANGRRDPNNITMYNVSKKLVSKDRKASSMNVVRFKYEPAFDGYAGVSVPGYCFMDSANENFYHIRMPKTTPLTMTYKKGIRSDNVESKSVTPREFKDMFEETRKPYSKKKADKTVQRTAEANEVLDDVVMQAQAQEHVYDMDSDFRLPF